MARAPVFTFIIGIGACDRQPRPSVGWLLWLPQLVPQVQRQRPEFDVGKILVARRWRHHYYNHVAPYFHEGPSLRPGVLLNGSILPVRKASHRGEEFSDHPSSSIEWSPDLRLAQLPHHNLELDPCGSRCCVDPRRPREIVVSRVPWHLKAVVSLDQTFLRAALDPRCELSME